MAMSARASVITPSQTVGPFFSFCLTRPGAPLSRLGDHRLVTDGVEGVRVTIGGRMFDGGGRPVPDAMIEIWQADGQGRYARSPSGPVPPSFTGFGRVECDAEGRFVIETVKPGRAPAPGGGLQAPHVALGIFGKGLNRRLYTRLYFDDEPGNDSDLVLTSVPAARRKTLISRSTGKGRYEFDIRLQGDDETVFFEA
jgi:protocatechuate 3,4-dioxygenase alpha subunit